jgi:SMC interacting uncharacterized protein involved in chromosome segregation
MKYLRLRSRSVSPAPEVNRYRFLRLERKPDELRVEKDQLKQMIEKVDKFCEDWKNRCPAIEPHNLGLEAACQEREEECARAWSENEELKKQVAKKQEEKEALELQLKEQKQKNQDLTTQAAMFRNIVIKRSCSDTDEIDDDSVIRSFARLRKSIQRIALKHCHLDPQRPPMTRMKLTPEQNEFFDFWDEKCSVPELQLRLRAKIFSMIHKYFFSTPMFGLEDEPTRDIEEGLVKFELGLEKMGVGKQQKSFHGHM